MDSAVGIEVTKLDPVEPLTIRSAPFVSQPEIDCEPRRNLPIILEIERGLFRLVGDRRVNGNPTVIAIAQKQVCESVALSDVEVKGNLLRNVLSKVKIARGKGRLPKVVKEQALLAANSHAVASFHPGQHRGITVERMREVGVRAALGKQRRPGRIH